jgi:uncharacterized Ntn-hydrolase superfamily protein
MWASTYSIVACDLETREWGVAVASKFLAIGALSAWAEPEVGAIATQGWIRAAYGEEGLELLRNGYSAEDALQRLVDADDGRDQRQVGFVDRSGNVASHTGARCLAAANSRLGEGYAAQGNLLASAEAIDAMAERFESSVDRPLPRRLLECLDAAQADGGDRRGQQAASLRVVREGGGYGEANVSLDLRVDDHEQPLDELRRLYDLHDLYFGSTPDEEWLVVDKDLGDELHTALEGLGYATGDLAGDLETWAGVENLEERVSGVERIDPVVLGELRARARGGSRMPGADQEVPRVAR